MKVSGLLVDSLYCHPIDVTRLGDATTQRAYGDMTARLTGSVTLGQMAADVRLTDEESAAIAAVLARVVARYEGQA